MTLESIDLNFCAKIMEGNRFLLFFVQVVLALTLIANLLLVA